MSTHLVILRDGTEYHVTAQQATKIQQAIEAKRNFYLADNYLAPSEVKSIRKLGGSEDRLSAGDAFCGKCEKGWIIGERGAYPCSCNHQGKGKVLEYAERLRKTAKERGL